MSSWNDDLLSLFFLFFFSLERKEAHENRFNDDEF